MTVLGNIVIAIALLAAAASALSYFRSSSLKGTALRWPRRFLAVSALFVLLASALLLFLILRHDYSIAYVYSYSDNALPLHFLISSFYAGQEGSFLFWTLCSVLIALVLKGYTAKRSLEAPIMAVFMTIETLLLLLVMVKSPFRSLWSVFPNAPQGLPADGHGLNPLLQNFWMVIHPPVLFIGFAAMAVPFSMAASGLWKKKYTLLPEQGFPWLLFATFVLGLGIMLGAYWAYGVLGWGGYWGWDPVENSSLVPWIIAVAMLHTMLAQLRTGKYVRTNFALALSSFTLVVYSTFLTRSGILGDASVHSFTDPGATVYWLILGILGVITLSSVALLVLRWSALRTGRSDGGLFTRETSLGAGTIVLVFCALVVLFGTSLPIVPSLPRVEPSWYDRMNLPLAIIMALLIGYSLYLQWETSDGLFALKRSLGALIASLLASVALYVFGVTDTMALLLIFTSLFALFVNIEIGVKVARGDPRFLGGKVAHAGIAVFLIGVIATGKFSTKEHIELPLNTPRAALGHTLTYSGFTRLADGKFAFNVRVEGSGTSFMLSPVMFDNPDQGTMRNPDIASFLTRDFYLSPISIEEGTVGAQQESYTIEKGQTVAMGNVKAKFVSFDIGNHDAQAMMAGGGMTIGSVLELTDGTSSETVIPAMINANGRQQYRPSSSKLMNASITLVRMNVSMGGSPSSVTLEVVRPGAGAPRPQTLVVEASVKPFITCVWGGTVLLMIGFVLAILKRSKES